MLKFLYTLAFTILFSLSAFNQTTVWDIISDSPDHLTLSAAIEQLELDELLSDLDEEFTVFAPTDDAFDALDPEFLEELLDDELSLLFVILFHVAEETILSSDLFDGAEIETAIGLEAIISIIGDDVFIEDALITAADLIADNGVVHIIDAVMIPADEPFTVFDIISESDDHLTLQAVLEQTGLDETLSDPDGEFTVFAPTDDAFEAIDSATLEAILADEDLLTDILLYHVVGAVAFSDDLEDGQEITTLLGQDIVVTFVSGNIFINDALVTVADLEADNGVVHVIDAVLIPEADEPFTVFDIISESEDHLTLQAAIEIAGLDGVLSDPDGTFTVFAPTDDAFEAIDPEVLEAILDDEDLLTAILLYHVVGEIAFSSDLEDGQEITTLLGQDIVVTFDNGSVFINNALVTIADLEADNGVVHVIDAVLLPEVDEPFTVFDIISESEDHLTLQAAIEIAGLDGVLSDPDGTFTVFAPTDDAFEAIDPEVLEAILDDEDLLTAILLYHVVGAIAFSDDLEDGQEIETALGENITVTFENGNIFINDAQVTIADLEADNGVVHVIDAVLLPPLGPCVEFVGGPFGNFNEEPFNGAPAPGPDGTCEVFQLPFGAWASEIYAVENFQEGVEYTFSICEGAGAGSWEPELTIFNADGQLVTFVQDCEITWTATYTGTYLIGINEVGACGAASDNLETDNGFPTLTCTGVELPETVWDIVVGSDVHNTLETAINAAGLVETLQGEGPFTLFAPTDDAFDALPEGLLEALLDDSDGDLTDVLLYHVLAGQVLSTDLSDGMVATTVLGQDIVVTIENGNVFINDAQVIIADILAQNGVVHVIDAVLVPDLNTTRNLDVVDISIYPNPVSDYLQLDLPSELINQDVTVEVINIQGQTVQQFRFNGNAENLNVSNLPAGTYLLNIISDNFIGRDRFIKQ